MFHESTDIAELQTVYHVSLIADLQVADNMVIGIDSYHDSAKKGRSVGAFVASLNKSFTRYYSQTIMQSNMQELIDGLKTCMTGLCQSVFPLNTFIHLPVAQ